MMMTRQIIAEPHPRSHRHLVGAVLSVCVWGGVAAAGFPLGKASAFATSQVSTEQDNQDASGDGLEDVPVAPLQVPVTPKSPFEDPVPFDKTIDALGNTFIPLSDGRAVSFADWVLAPVRRNLDRPLTDFERRFFLGDVARALMSGKGGSGLEVGPSGQPVIPPALIERSVAILAGPEFKHSGQGPASLASVIDGDLLGVGASGPRVALADHIQQVRAQSIQWLKDQAAKSRGEAESKDPGDTQ